MPTSLARPRVVVASAVALLSCAGTALAHDDHTHAAHVHGTARIEVVQEATTLTIHLESPLANVFGFERAPRTDAEKATARQALQRLRDGQTLFAPTPAAGCRLDTVKLDFGGLTSAFVDDTVNEARATSKPPATSGEHADVDADYTFRCQTPDALRQLEVRLFDAFPAVRRVTVQLVTPTSQAGGNLTPTNRKLSW